VVVFDTEQRAYTGYRALKDLDAEGSIVLYGQAVVAKDADGKVSVREAADQGPLGTAVGLVVGSLVGLVGGPVGVAVGAAAGTMGGATYDLATAVVGDDFLDETARSLGPGKWAVVAEVDEEWATPLDARMQAVGGTVLRRARGEVVDAQIAREDAALDAEIAALETEYERATGEAKAKLRTKIDAARARLQKTRDDARTRLEAAQVEAEAKIAALKAQAASAQTERKQQLDKRAAEVQAEYRERRVELDRARELDREALARKPDGGTAEEGPAGPYGLIAQVREGMSVVDAAGKEIGRVRMVQMGDPGAVSTEGQYQEVALLRPSEPDVPGALQPGMVRMGFVKVERGGPPRPGKHDHYVRADQIAAVAGGRVTLAVAEAKLADGQEH